MLVNELLNQLAVGKLSNLGLVDDNGFDIKPEKLSQLVQCLNAGLKRIYTRFMLKQSSLVLQMQDGLPFYYLLARYAVNHYDAQHPLPDGLVPYILDDPGAPFDDDVAKVIRVVRSDGVNYPIGDADSCNAVFLPSPNLLQVTNVVPGKTLEVIYQASHPRLYTDELSHEIELPDTTSFIEALLSYTAYGVYSAIGTQESTVKAQEHLTMYENACKEAEGAGAATEEAATVSDKFCRQGWV